MKYAKSMYLAGDIVEAKECNFNSSRELGLVCPLCSQAVYLRSGGVREQILRNGKERLQVIQSYFAHYKTGVDDLDCENRVYTKEGRNRLEQIRIESRNQRLDLYNNHLWEMFKEDRNISRPFWLKFQKILGRRFVETVVRDSRKLWAEDGEYIYKLMESNVQMIVENKDSIKKISRSTHFYPEELEKQHEYFTQKCKLRLHLAICCEIADFMKTRTSGYFWAKLIPILVPIVGNEFSLSDKQELKKILNPATIELLITGTVVATHWIEQISKRLGEKP